MLHRNLKSVIHAMILSFYVMTCLIFIVVESSRTQPDRA